MNFKKSKNQVVNDATAAAHSRISYSLQQVNNGNISNVGDVVRQAIIDAIGEAIRSLVNDTYTDQEFEEDMTLRDK